MLWVRVGSMDEVDGASGVAHVLEHMLFKGTRDLKPGEFSRRVAALGGRENAFTTRDATGYFQQIPANKLEEVMKLEADRFANNQWPDEEFKRELEVVKEERRLRTEDSPRSLMWEVLNATVYQASPYRRPVVGWMSDLEAMTPQDARDFYKQWYVPANAVVVVAGDVEPAQVLRLAREVLRPHARRGRCRRASRASSRSRPACAAIEFKAPADQAYVALAFKVPQLTSFEPGAGNDDALALTVLAAVLDGYSGARLDRALTQGSDRVADSAGAGNGLWGRGPAAVHARRRARRPARRPSSSKPRCAPKWRKWRSGGVSEAELNRVKTQWIAGEVYKLDSVNEPGPRARQLLDPGPAAGWSRPVDPAPARRHCGAGEGRRRQILRR